MSNNNEGRLANIRLLEGLGDEEKSGLEKRCRWRRYKTNEQILDKDSNDRDVYFVAEGTVQVVNFSMTGREIALGPVDIYLAAMIAATRFRLAA